LKRSLLPYILLASLMVLSFMPSFASTESKPIVVVHYKGALEVGVQLEAAMNNITSVDWVVVTGNLTSTNLTEASMLIMIQVDSSLNYTDEELSAVKDWFDTGGKTIWVAGDSDYGTDRFRIPSANAVLEEIGSVLRLEDCEAVDPSSNAGADYRVIGLSENCDEEVDFLVDGVTRALFHGPGIIVGYVNGSYVKLEEEKPENVYVVMTTSENGTVAEFNAPSPEIHEVGDNGTFVLMALELDETKKNIIIATADAPFDHYTGMYMPELIKYERYAVEYPQQGARLFENIIDYMIANKIAFLQGQVTDLEGQVTTLQDQVTDLQGQVDTLKKSIGTWQGVSAGTFVIGLIIGVVVVYFMKRS